MEKEEMKYLFVFTILTQIIKIICIFVHNFLICCFCSYNNSANISTEKLWKHNISLFYLFGRSVFFADRLMYIVDETSQLDLYVVLFFQILKRSKHIKMRIIYFIWLFLCILVKYLFVFYVLLKFHTPFKLEKFDI